eukprot:853519_1
MEISFYFNMTDECISDWCNILQIGDKYDIASLYMTGNRTNTSISVQKSMDSKVGTHTLEFTNDSAEHLLSWHFNRTTHVIYIDGVYIGSALNHKHRIHPSDFDHVNFEYIDFFPFF